MRRPSSFSLWNFKNQNIVFLRTPYSTSSSTWNKLCNTLTKRSIQFEYFMWNNPLQAVLVESSCFTWNNSQQYTYPQRKCGYPVIIVDNFWRLCFTWNIRNDVCVKKKKVERNESLNLCPMYLYPELISLSSHPNNIINENFSFVNQKYLLLNYLTLVIIIFILHFIYTNKVVRLFDIYNSNTWSSLALFFNISSFKT